MGGVIAVFGEQAQNPRCLFTGIIGILNCLGADFADSLDEVIAMPGGRFAKPFGKGLGPLLQGRFAKLSHHKLGRFLDDLFTDTGRKPSRASENGHP